MRAYTVHELDALRQVVESKWLYGWYSLPAQRSNDEGGGTGYVWTRGVWSRSYDPNEKVKAVEEMVRTHMLAGHTAEDLIKSEDEARARAEAAMAQENKTG